MEREPLRSDRVLLRLFCAWMFLQCFLYTAIPSVRWSLGLNWTPDKLALIAMLAVVALRQPPSPWSVPETRAGKGVARLLALFTAIAVTSWWVNGADAGNATFGQLTRVLNLSLFPAVAFFVARRIRYSRSMVTELLGVFAVIGVYLSVTAIAEHYNVAALVFPKYILDPTVGIHMGRSRGPFVNTIANGGMLLLSFLALSGFFASLAGGRRVLVLGLMLLVVPAIYFTETRSVWLGLAAIVATVLVLRTRIRFAGAAVAGVLVIAFLSGIGSKFSAFDQMLFARRQNTIDYRLDNYQIVWSAFKANPVFGLGYGKLQMEWSNYAVLRETRLGVGLEDGNHNTLLGILGELGLVGAIPFIGMIACAAILCISAYRRARDSCRVGDREFAVIALGTLEIFLVLGLTSDLKAVPTVNIAAFWFAGAIASLDRAARSEATRGTVLEGSKSPSPRRQLVQGGRRLRPTRSTS